ncbi:hypothetical protein BH11BAC3_BH11BAC3_06950 [soil metagenome]
MNIEEQWKDMQEQQDDDLNSMLKMPFISQLSSKDPLQKIKRNLLLHSIYGILIAGLYVIILVRFPFWQLLLCIGTVLLFTIWAAVKALLLYKKLSDNNNALSVLQQMEHHYTVIKKWMSLQQWVALVIYPISAAGGFMLGGFLGSGKPIEVFMQKPIIIIALVIVTAILVPICHWLAKWMSRKAFGRYAEALKQNIEAFKKEN